MSVVESPLLPSQRAMLHVLRKRGPSTRADIGRVCGLSSAAVTRFGRELIDRGLIAETTALARKGPGRPTQHLSLRGDAGALIGFALHPGWLEAVSLDFGGSLQFGVRQPLAEPTSFHAATQAMKAFIREHRARVALPILGVGLAAPGYVTLDARLRHFVAGLEAWRDLDIASALKSKLGYVVDIENDASAAALGEYFAPEARAARVVMAITMGGGVGGGVVAEGRLLRGAHGNAGEIGWLWPYGAPRPSARDFFECCKAALGLDALCDLCVERVEPRGAIDNWCARAAEQLILGVSPGGGWIDPDRIVLTGPLPPAVLACVAGHLGARQLFEPETNLTRPKPAGSQLGAQAAAIGAALLPALRMIDG